MKSAESTKLGTAGNSMVGQANAQGIAHNVNKPPGWRVWSPLSSLCPAEGPSMGKTP